MVPTMTSLVRLRILTFAALKEKLRVLSYEWRESQQQVTNMKYHNEIERRKTFAIISHPDTGKIASTFIAFLIIPSA